MALTARICIFANPNGTGDEITEIHEFDLPTDPAKRRRHLMRRIGAIVDLAAKQGGPTSISVAFPEA